jgi:hypothetical protein
MPGPPWRLPPSTSTIHHWKWHVLCRRGGAITTPDSAEFDFGSADFNIEFYFWKNIATGTERNIAGQRLGVGGANTTRSWNIEVNSTGKVRGLVYQGSTEIACLGTTTFGISTAWHTSRSIVAGRPAAVRGRRPGGSTAITGAINNSSGNISIGQDGEDTSGRWNGWIDEFTIALFARRTAAFTPDTVAAIDSFESPLLPALNTLRFAVDTDYLPSDITAIPSIKEVQVDPAIITLGENLGQRATVTVKFKDHRHVFASEGFYSGTICHRVKPASTVPFRVIRAPRSVDRCHGVQLCHRAQPDRTRQASSDSREGHPKFTAGDRSLAPRPSSGFLAAAWTRLIPLSPVSVGLALSIQPRVCSNRRHGNAPEFTRSGDVLTITDWDVLGPQLSTPPRRSVMLVLCGC